MSAIGTMIETYSQTYNGSRQISAVAGLNTLWARMRERGIALAVQHPRVVTALMFMFLFTVAQKVDYVAQTHVISSSFWGLILVGSLVGFFGAMPVYELIQKHRQLAEVQLVRRVVSTLHHEINNPMAVIMASAGMMNDLDKDNEFIGLILKSGLRVQEVMTRLSSLDRKVRLNSDPGFAGVIDLEKSE